MSDGGIRFYFDFISPNAYLAWFRIHEVGKRHDRTVTLVPVLFAGLLNAHGRLGPAETPATARWMFRDVLRKAARLGIPLAPPRSHPFNPLLALRLASTPMPDATRVRLIDGLFRAVWAGGPGVTDPAEVARVASAAGLPGERAVREAGEPEAKNRLRRQTEEAVVAGVFGVPTMLVGDELFWGFDDMDHLELHLQGRDPLPRAALASWEAIRPSAVRRRPPG